MEAAKSLLKELLKNGDYFETEYMTYIINLIDSINKDNKVEIINKIRSSMERLDCFLVNFNDNKHCYDDDVQDIFEQFELIKSFL